ncbi:MAG: hypothetical protein U0797_05935 [Gemmataceae bacterium]
MSAPDPRIIAALKQLREKDKQARRATSRLFKALGLAPDVVPRVVYCFRIAGAHYRTRLIPLHQSRIEDLVTRYPRDPDQFYTNLSRLLPEFSRPVYCALQCLEVYIPPPTQASKDSAMVFGGGVPAPGCCTFNDRSPPREDGWSQTDCISMPTHVRWDPGPCPVTVPDDASKLAKAAKKPKAASKPAANK